MSPVCVSPQSSCVDEDKRVEWCLWDNIGQEDKCQPNVQNQNGLGNESQCVILCLLSKLMYDLSLVQRLETREMIHAGSTSNLSNKLLYDPTENKYWDLVSQKLEIYLSEAA